MTQLSKHINALISLVYWGCIVQYLFLTEIHGNLCEYIFLKSYNECSCTIPMWKAVMRGQYKEDFRIDFRMLQFQIKYLFTQSKINEDGFITGQKRSQFKILSVHWGESELSLLQAWIFYYKILPQETWLRNVSTSYHKTSEIKAI
jgi:hypothetical protein